MKTLIHETPEAKAVELKLLLEGLFLRYGYDFRQYAEQSMRRRVDQIKMKLGYHCTLDLLRDLLHDPSLFNDTLPQFTVGTTEMFRDPEFFRSLRERVIPALRTFPMLNVWIAGTSTGEELYSLLILLQEEGLLERSVVFATDINRAALQTAQAGIYPAELLSKYEANYRDAGGKAKLGEYFTKAYDHFKFDSALKTNVVFSEHNLAVDSDFTEAHLILCRNVLIYFDRGLQDRALRLFSASLGMGGYLALGSKESLRFSSIATEFETLDDRWKIYRKRTLQ